MSSNRAETDSSSSLQARSQQMAGSRQRIGDIPADIEHDYFRRPDRLTRWKTRLAWFGAIASIILIGLMINWPEAARAVSGDEDTSIDAALLPLLKAGANHGVLSSVHAAWDNDCDACHVPFAPIRPESAAHLLMTGAIERTNAKCNRCHLGTTHHANLITLQDLDSPDVADQPDPHVIATLKAYGAKAACASCHIDHRGREADLVAVADSKCIVCHADLTPFLKTEPPPGSNHADGWLKIASFSTQGHPNFSTEQKDFEDPGKLKFNHQMHMAAGIPGQTDAYFRYRNIEDAALRTTYLTHHAGSNRADLDTLVELNCNSCHESGSNNASATELTSGRYFSAINFERHCVACHQQDLAVPATAGPKGSGADPVIVPVPHGLSLDTTLDWVSAFVTKNALTESTSLIEQLRQYDLRSPSADVRDILRGFRVESGPKNDSDAVATAAGVARIRDAMLNSDQSCAQCHFYEAAGDVAENGEQLIGETSNDTNPYEQIKIAATNVPTVWFKSAKFDHVSHRTIDCLGCHDGAVTGDDTRPKSVTQGTWLVTMANEKLIPGINNCVGCHAPRTTSASGTVSGGINHNCSLCHNYHSSDHIPAGLSLPAPGTETFRRADEMLNVKPR
ncbi:hypothetical protein [Stratiformator vulcanicus]|uniref:Uncharacterized protein n=1 Tax=Stratiformator vulcanicus TaxID=2527980 RepID=A0A517QX27_9PLAN|nr:hypothetical protein [Stratiformator vulcanicus]QDT36191.1 hypothetical protein Pan189_05460 [Stratiformator vulcanicus]